MFTYVLEQGHGPIVKLQPHGVVDGDLPVGLLPHGVVGWRSADPSVGLHGHVRGHCDDWNHSTFYSLTCSTQSAEARHLSLSYDRCLTCA
jgi:hypothetical protein